MKNNSNEKAKDINSQLKIVGTILYADIENLIL